MTNERVKELLRKDEGLTIEFKCCTGRVEHDVFVRLGYGVRNLYKYAKAYGGADPQLKDGDVFRIEIPFTSMEVAPISAEVAPIGAEVAPISAEVAQRAAEVAQRSAEVAQRLSGKGRADAINNAVTMQGSSEGSHTPSHRPSGCYRSSLRSADMLRGTPLVSAGESYVVPRLIRW